MLGSYPYILFSLSDVLKTLESTRKRCTYVSGGPPAGKMKLEFLENPKSSLLG